MLTLKINDVELAVLCETDHTSYRTKYWWLELHKDGRYRLWPPPQFTHDLVKAHVDGVINWKATGIVYNVWREDMFPRAVAFLAAVGLLREKKTVEF